MKAKKIENYIIKNKDKLPLSYNDLILVKKSKANKIDVKEKHAKTLFENLEFYKKISRF